MSTPEYINKNLLVILPRLEHALISKLPNDYVPVPTKRGLEDSNDSPEDNNTQHLLFLYMYFIYN